MLSSAAKRAATFILVLHGACLAMGGEAVISPREVGSLKTQLSPPGVEALSLSDGKNSSVFTIAGKHGLVLPANVWVLNGCVSEDGRTAAFVACRAVPPQIGLWYWGMITAQLTPAGAWQLTATMFAQDLKDIDGCRRDIARVEAVDDYPHLKLRVSNHPKKTGIYSVDRRIEIWNVEQQVLENVIGKAE